MSKQITFQDAICFAASSFYYLVEKMQMDLHEPPMSQVAFNSVSILHTFSYSFCRFDIVLTDLIFRHFLGWTRANSTNFTG